MFYDSEIGNRVVELPQKPGWGEMFVVHVRGEREREIAKFMMNDGCCLSREK